ncbi:30S ribosome-binding factor RbfA [Thermodesulfobacteriota bacterium]
MLAGKRNKRVGDLLLREIADLLIKKVRDPRVQGVTLSGIEMSQDLKHAKIYFSVLGEEQEVQKAQQGLDSAKGFIKREAGHRLNLKYVPEIQFRHDPTLDKGDHLERLFQKIKTEESSDLA